MRSVFRRSGVIAGAAALSLTAQARAVVGLAFTDNDSTPTSASVAPGSTFKFSTKLTETLATEQISGVDYQIHSSANGVFEFLSRNSNPAGDNFNSPNGSSDAALMAVILNPNNGTDLGTSTSSGLGIPGPGTYELADFTFEVLPGTPAGIYTLSFTSTSDSGPPPGYATGSFGTLGTFTVSVPEPASISLLAIAGSALSFRRRRKQIIR